MNYHLMIDHWFLRDFIETAEEVSPSLNTYIITDHSPTKHIKSGVGVFAPYGSRQLDTIIDQITSTDRLFIHWFHEPVLAVLKRLKAEVPVYLPFWGGDLIMQTSDSIRFNYDPLTKAYQKKLERFIFSGSVKMILKRLIDKLKEDKIKKARIAHDVGVRKLLLARINFFCHWNLLDLQAILLTYGGSPRFIPFFYDPNLNRIDTLDSLVKRKSSTTVWLGNSDTMTNNHIDAIHVLSKFKEHVDMNVICPLSYGTNPAYGNEITLMGEKIFNDKWESLREFMSIDIYLQRQQEADVVVMYHNRTQAAGNVMAFIKMGKKIFLKSQSTLYTFLKNNNIVVFDANEIINLSFEEFSRPLTQEQSKLNATLIMQLFSDEKKKECYRNLLIG